MKPLGLTANALAKAIGVPANRITAILKDERGITGDTAIRLGTFFKTSAEFWMNLQMTYDLRNAEKSLPARVRKSIEDNRSVLGLRRLAPYSPHKVRRIILTDAVIRRYILRIRCGDGKVHS